MGEMASSALEVALQQMDGIISDAVASIALSSPPAPNNSSSTSTTNNNTAGDVSKFTTTATSKKSSTNDQREKVLTMAKTLAVCLEELGENTPIPDSITAAVITNWLDTHIPREVFDKQHRRLLHEKEELAKEYQKLQYQISEQTDKIIELECLLTERTQQLSTKEELLERQILTRSALETQKLELMTALSELKLQQAAMQRENWEIEDERERERDRDRERFDNGNLSAMKGSSFCSLGNLFQGTYDKTPLKNSPRSLRFANVPQFHSLPRTHTVKSDNNTTANTSHNQTECSKLNVNNNNNNNNNSINSNNNKQRVVMFASDAEVFNDSSPYDRNVQSKSLSSNNSTAEKSAKGLLNIFGKLRRSNSGNLEHLQFEKDDGEFIRGTATRATTGGRIEWNTSQPLNTKNCMNWTPDEAGNWLSDIGLSCYADDCKKWLKNHPSICFFTTPAIDIEKELNLKMPLHRKKIVLAMDQLTGREKDPLALQAGQLDVGWVMRWLDDIGLPQYKDNFMLAKVDGACLHRLTMEDLAQLQVNSCLHIASLRCGIQCMRETDWNPECLIRRSTNAMGNNSEDEYDVADKNVALWTAHRVMEWLRLVDLAEYAPNLRGAGVHGALMMYEARFNADLLADLLSIPPSKTLLRRHLATHFKELVGREIIQLKRDAELAPGHQPLTTAAKVKPPKKTQFSLKRRKSNKVSVNSLPSQ